MIITIKTVQTGPLATDTYISDGKNSLTISKNEEGLGTVTSLQSNGDSIYPIMDLLKILEAVG